MPDPAKAVKSAGKPLALLVLPGAFWFPHFLAWPEPLLWVSASAPPGMSANLGFPDSFTCD